MATTATVTIEGKIEKVIWSDASKGVAIARIYAKANDPTHLTAVGPISQFRQGQALSLIGEWTTSPRFGEQLKVLEATAIRPTTTDGITQHLADIGIAGIGFGKAKRIVQMFGEQTLDVIENSPDKLADVNGLKPDEITALHDYMTNSRESAEFGSWMRKLGIGPKTAHKIYETYKRGSKRVIQENPYILAHDIDGVGFVAADTIACGIGFAANSPFRIRAGISHVLREAAGKSGHVCLPMGELVEAVAVLLEQPIDAIPPIVADMADPRSINGTNPLIQIDGDMVYDRTMHAAEVNVAAKIRALMAAPALFDRAHIATALEQDEAARGAGFAYNEAQKNAILRIADTNLLIITGGPGTGKTTIIKALIAVLKNKGLEVNLASPTGRAAQRMEEATGEPAQTIHRLLQFNPFAGGFTKNENDPLKGAVIIDETSMLDISLADSLLRAIEPGTPLILVGDVDQLPSVGPGTVLRDLIGAKVPTQFLNVIMRQAEGSMIISNSHRINRGDMPLTPTAEQARTADYHFIQREDPAEAAAEVVKLVTERLPKIKGYTTTDQIVRNIQVLSPQRKGETGVNALNKALQDALNVNESCILVGDDRLKPGDKVMQTANNYTLNVFNGEIGVIESVDLKSKTVKVAYERKKAIEVVTYEQKHLEQLALAYATTCHKSQGSEYEVVVIPVSKSHYNMLQRNLIYTAITRAKKMVVIVGTTAAMERAVGNNEIEKRYSLLAKRISD